MPDIQIKRGYEVLPDNNVRFGIRVINDSDFAISDVEVILDYSASLFELEGTKIQKLGTIPPTVPRTAEFILKPLGCIHNEEIGATILYKDHQWKKHTLEMHPKEVHCVCPFLKQKKITKSEFLSLSRKGHVAETGLNFDGVSPEQVVSFFLKTCRGRYYKVDNASIEGGNILYLASESIGEKAHYLLTALIKENDGLTQVMLRAVSNKPHGLNGFLNEVVEETRHIVNTVNSAHEIGIIRKEQVINIIDSVVQRTSFGGGEEKASVNIKGSIVQRSEFGVNRGIEKREENESLQRQRDEEETVKKELQARSNIKSKSTSEKRWWKLGVIGLFCAIWFVVILSGFNSSNPATSVELNTATPTPTKPVMTPIAGQKEFINSAGIEFALIPKGEFDMGSSGEGVDMRFYNNGPIHHVEIKKDFYIGKYEITQKQWRDVMGKDVYNFYDNNTPVYAIFWDDAQQFIYRLNEIEGTNKYRLPSEAEWEYAARAGSITHYFFGDDASKFSEYAWIYENSGKKSHPVGQKNPNPWGLYDIYGNVNEFVQDSYHANYSGAPTDGSAWENKYEMSYRVHRGVNFMSNSNQITQINSFSRSPVGMRDSGYVGFRLVRDV